jgi:hypothetical protein
MIAAVGYHYLLHENHFETLEAIPRAPKISTVPFFNSTK